MAQFVFLTVALLSALLGVVAIAETSDNPASILISEIGRTNNASLLWGPYRPNLYFGVRPRIPNSFTGALMWSRVDSYEAINTKLRSTCEQHNGINGYGWDEYDIRTGGQQTIRDADNGIDITTKFVKVPGGSHGGSWGVRIRGVPRDDAPRDLKTLIVFQASLEGLGSLRVSNERDTLGYEGDVDLEGDSNGLGKYLVTITTGKGKHPDSHNDGTYEKKPLDRTMVYSATRAEAGLWQHKEILFERLRDEVEGYKALFEGKDVLPPPEQMFTIPNDPGEGNYHLIQKTWEGPFEFDILFSSLSAGEALTSQKLSGEITQASQSFQKRFKEIFPRQAPFNEAKYDNFAKSMFSNLFGGIGYFYGDAVVDRTNDDAYLEEDEGFYEQTAKLIKEHNGRFDGPYELFSSIPSRPFFPRGFLWDEGFHLLPIADWDTDVTMDIVKSWYNLIDEDGWIGREQILGHEARSKVPLEFTTQYPHYANPPTLYLILEGFVDRLGAKNGTTPAVKEKIHSTTSSLQNAHLDHPEVADQYLRDIYPLLKRQYDWFRRTQAGDIKSYDREAFSSKEAYRWRGRSVDHILTSGLDDYPRAQPPHPGELHVDLISWIGLMSRSLVKIARAIGENEDADQYALNEAAILRNIEDLHWSEKEQTFCDATIDDYEEHVHVCHKGYITIFPFLTGNLKPDSPRLGAILDLIGNENELWSEFGLRSLAKSSEFYQTGENYWRSPIWVNMNYLAISQLFDLAQTTSPHAARAGDLYNRLRQNLVNTVHTSWKETGFAWEQYNPEDGQGQRTQHFTGWTSLVVKIMTMPQIKNGKAHDEL